jgi:hypothetical protein
MRPSIRRWLGSAMADLLSPPRPRPSGQPVHVRYEAAGLTLPGPPVPWCADAVVVELPLKLPPSARVRGDFVLRLPGRDPVPAEAIRKDELDDRVFRAFFRIPTPAASATAEVVWQNRRLIAPVPLPVQTADQFLTELKLANPTVGVKLGRPDGGRRDVRRGAVPGADGRRRAAVADPAGPARRPRRQRRLPVGTDPGRIRRPGPADGLATRVEGSAGDGVAAEAAAAGRRVHRHLEGRRAAAGDAAGGGGDGRPVRPVAAGVGRPVRGVRRAGVGAGRPPAAGRRRDEPGRPVLRRRQPGGRGGGRRRVRGDGPGGRVGQAADAVDRRGAGHGRADAVRTRGCSTRPTRRP